MDGILYVFLIIISYYLLSLVLVIDFREFDSIRERLMLRAQYYQMIDYLRSEIHSGAKVPRFLFYSEIIEKLIILRRKYGINTNKSLQEIRSAVRRSYKVEVEIKSELLGFFFQYFFVAGFTWFFLFQLELSLNIHFEYLSMIFLLFWQLTGSIGFLVLFYSYKRFKLRSAEQLIQSMNIFRGLMLSSRPFGEVLEESKVNKISWTKVMLPIRKQVEGMVKHIKEVGGLSENDFHELMYECWDLYEHEIQLFKKMLLAFKLLFILFFVFIGFLYMTYSAMGQLGF